MSEGQFESDARNAAVVAVENRVARRFSDEKRQKRISRIRRWISILVLTAILLAIVKVASEKYDIEIPLLTSVDFNLSSKWFSAVFPSVQPASREEVDRRNAYVGILHSLRDARLASWRDAPNEVKPKNASRAAVYHAILPNRGHCATIYELLADGNGGFTMHMLSPVAKSVAITAAEFKAACAAAKVFFILYGGKAYVCGKCAAGQEEDLRTRILMAYRLKMSGL